QERQDECLVLGAVIVEDGIAAEQVLGEGGKRTHRIPSAEQRQEAEGSQQRRGEELADRAKRMSDGGDEDLAEGRTQMPVAPEVHVGLVAKMRDDPAN